MHADLSHVETGTGTPLVLIHPVGLDASFWQPVADILSARHRVIAVDLRGHGQTPFAPGAHTVEDHAEDVHRLIAALRIGPVIVAGLSFGGMIAQSLAITHPEDVSALIVAGCGDGFPPEARIALAERGALAERDGMEAVVETTLERWFTPEFRAAGKDAPTRERLLTDDVRGWAGAWRAIATLDNAERLRAVKVPSLMIAGELDKAGPVAALAAMADRIPGARLEVLAGAPHMMQIEQPAAFANAISRFLASQTAR